MSTAVAASSSIVVGSVGVEVEVRPQESGDVVCIMNCNGSEVAVTYEEDGGIMTVAEGVKHHFTAKALGKA